MKDFAGAGRDFDRALELDPKSSLAWANRGAVKIKQGDFQGALPDLEQAILLNPAQGDAYVNRGTARASLGDLQGALAEFDPAVALLPGSVNAWTNRGFAKIILGDLEGALADCNRALALAPEHGKALWGRGAAQIEVGKRAEGCLDLEKAWNLGVNAAKLEWDKSCSGNNPKKIQGIVFISTRKVMDWKQLFTPVKAIEPEEAKGLMAGWPEGSYTLLDVRQPGEYKEKHLPGAKLIPMAQLPEALKDLNPERPVIVY